MNLCIVGVGPRGLSCLERLVARARSGVRRVQVVVHLVDPYPAGAGAVWRTDQADCLLMNTVASQVTVFADRTAGPAVPLLYGPSLYEWARQDPHERADAPGPDDYPSRARYGRYLRWALERVLCQLPDGMTVRIHRDRAVGLTEDDAGQVVRLAGGTVLGGLDAVVLSQGHLPGLPTPQEAGLEVFAERHGLRYVAPANPADTDLSGVAPGARVLLRGLGLCFFDHLALLTTGRGGSFRRGPDGRLGYLPSGREPVLFAGSRRGLPYQARGANEKGPSGVHEPAVLTPEVVEVLRKRGARGGGLSLCRDIWPYVAKEVETVYYTLLAGRSGRGGTADAALRQRLLAAPWGSAAEAAVLDAAGIGPADRWVWQRLARPAAGRAFTGSAHYNRWAAEHLREDVARAARGNLSDPVKAALDVLRDLRNQIRELVDHAGLTGASYRDELRGWYTPLNAFLSIGPPRGRIEEAVALMEAGILRLVGPDLRIEPDPAGPGFTAWSPAVAGKAVRAEVLIEARLPEPGLSRTADPLLRALLARGEAASYVVPDPDGPGYDTGALAVTGSPSRLVDRRGHAHPRRFAIGVPTEGVHWVTAVGIRPAVGSVTVQETDAVARALLDAALPARHEVAA
ncbi:FAD/NAD(P)-binding protein [Kitasatospora sp. NPDC089509]|uniref:FAD/NAD(P)-binding protein n=1 Tax=Kitasatospora sp. NPDC089509 TaxID=3364079 RepID=UPI003816FC68